MCEVIFIAHYKLRRRSRLCLSLCIFYCIFWAGFPCFQPFGWHSLVIIRLSVLLLGSYQWIYSQVGAWWPTYSINPIPHYSISMCLTFHIYPLTSSEHIRNCKSLNTKVCCLSSVPSGKTCVPFLVYRTVRRRTNICYTTVACNICIVSFLTTSVDLSQITFILSELHATDVGFKLVIGLSPGYRDCPHVPDTSLILYLSLVPAVGDGNKRT